MKNPSVVLNAIPHKMEDPSFLFSSLDEYMTYTNQDPHGDLQNDMHLSFVSGTEDQERLFKVGRVTVEELPAYFEILESSDKLLPVQVLAVIEGLGEGYATLTRILEAVREEPPMVSRNQTEEAIREWRDILMPFPSWDSLPEVVKRNFNWYRYAEELRSDGTIVEVIYEGVKWTVYGVDLVF